jgi:hypothetical protein
LGGSFDVQQGFQLKAIGQRPSRGVISRVPTRGFSKAVLVASDDYPVWELPTPVWVNLEKKNVRRPGAATLTGVPQVIINYAGPRDPWRFRAVVDDEGIAISSRFLAFRQRAGCKHSPRSLWAVLNSPLANGYAYCWSGKRQTLVREWLAMPLPEPTASLRSEIEAAAGDYLQLATPPPGFTLSTPDESAIRRALLELDAVVLRLYDLPPELELQLLALFAGVERPGVGCRFRGYPEGWSSRRNAPRPGLSQDDRPIWERIASLAASLPQDAIAQLPPDGASQHDHYLYGTPKKQR